MKVIYIAGKYRGETEWGLIENIRHAEAEARKWWLAGWAVICPHMNTAHFGGLLADPKQDHQLWIEGDLELVRRSDAICLLKGWSTSVGASAEYDLAVLLGKEIYFEEDLEK